MNERTTAVYDVNDCELILGGNASNDAASEAPKDRQSNEDKESYLFDFLLGERREVDPEARSAAEDHVNGLRNAQRDLDEALNLSEVLRGAMEEDGDSRAMQVDTVLKVVEKKVKKAHDRVDKHASRCRKLFLAYCELRRQSDNPAQ